MLILYTILLQITISHTYTPYPTQQIQQIKSREANQWESISNKFKASETLSFILQTRLIFYIKSKTFPQTIKMRAKAYFIGDDKKFIAIEQFSPFDVTKIYIYSEIGLIIKSQQFYETFAFEIKVKQNQMYQIMFVDGPPGPSKLIQWQIDSQFQLLNQPTLLPNQMSIMSSRIGQMQNFIIQGMHYTGISSIQQKIINEKLISQSQIFQFYIIFQAIFVIVVMFGQVAALKKLFLSDVIDIL